MSTKKHTEHPHLTGEHRWGDRGQLILLVLFLGIWITDSFIFHYSTSLLVIIAFYIRISHYEERILTKAFGNDCLEYKKKTGMLFPKLLSN